MDILPPKTKLMMLIQVNLDLTTCWMENRLSGKLAKKTKNVCILVCAVVVGLSHVSTTAMQKYFETCKIEIVINLIATAPTIDIQFDPAV